MLVLASASPRRQNLLRRRGVAFEVVCSGIDEAQLLRGEAGPSEWVMALAYIKARSVADAINDHQPAADALVIGADTMCVHDGELLGKPADEAGAKEMLRSFVGREHEVVTGVAIIELKTGRRRVFADPARVRWGEVSDDAIDAYVVSGGWRGKAGGYNLIERVSDGWPIEIDGCEESVMGLPVDRVLRALDELRDGGCDG